MASSNNINYENFYKKAQSIIDNASEIFATNLIKYSEAFTPKSSGTLLRSISIEREGSRCVGIKYNIAYAKKLYYAASYENSSNTNASPFWLHRGLNIYKKEIFNLMNNNLGSK